jgi:CRP-like cAMP-binding protein
MNIALARAVTPQCNLHLRGSNRLLTLLEAAGQDAVIARMERVTLERSTVLFNPDEPVTHAFFPLTGVTSLVINMTDGTALEVGTTGNEGMVGVPLVLGSDRSTTKCFVQIAGEFMRMESRAFAEQMNCNAAFADVMRRHALAFLAQTTQSCACLRFHPIEQRLCRWILTTHDRAGEQVLRLTQEFIALMLGAQRPSVSLAAATLQEAGLIRYHRGIIEVLNRQDLEATSCECYITVRREFERLLC